MEMPGLPSGRECFAHGACAGRGQRESLRLGSRHHVRHNFGKQCERLDGGGAMADAAPGEQVGTIPDIELVTLVPPNELQLLVLYFHWVTSCRALRTCFS